MITDREIVKQLNLLTRQSPFYARFNQQKYKNPKGYVEQETVTFQLARHLLSYQAYEASFFQEDFTHKHVLIVLNQAYNYGFKSLWLDEKLFEAFCYSQVPKTLIEFKRVIPVGLLLLPPKMRNPDGQLVKWVMFYHRLASEQILPINLPKANIQMIAEQVDTLTWLTLLDDGTLYAVNRRLMIEENRFNYQAKELESVLTSAKTPSKPASKKQKLNPIILGSSYQVKNQTSRDKVATGTRKSPTPHWRRGFYRW
jgi:hypothetical protein